MNDRQELLGHPKCLFVLFFAEMWERFSFYGMKALLILYMVNYLFWRQAEASHVMAWYAGLVYATPIFGGLIADKFLGARWSCNKPRLIKPLRCKSTACLLTPNFSAMYWVVFPSLNILRIISLSTIAFLVIAYLAIISLPSIYQYKTKMSICEICKYYHQVYIVNRIVLNKAGTVSASV